MNNKNKMPDIITRTEQLRSIIGDLAEVHSLLDILSQELAGGGIIKASHIQPMINDAVPKLRQAVKAMNTLAHQGGNCVEGINYESGSNRDPLLM
jgi:hypothetical protein